MNESKLPLLPIAPSAGAAGAQVGVRCPAGAVMAGCQAFTPYGRAAGAYQGTATDTDATGRLVFFGITSVYYPQSTIITHTSAYKKQPFSDFIG